MTAQDNYDSILGAPGTAVYTGTQRIENDEGWWEGPVHGVGYPYTNEVHLHAILTGAGAYEGLTAVLSANNDTNERVFELEAAIFPGELPEFP